MAIKKLGISLKQILEFQELDITNVDILKLGLRLIKIVEQLHQIGIVHLDIKPDNILIGDVSDILNNYDIDVAED